MARNMFMDAIKNEQKRIQGFIDLSSNFETDRGCLYVQKHGTNLYGYERKRSKDGTVQKIYLGPIASEKVQELFSIRLKTQRLSRLRHNQSLLNNIERSYQMYDFGSIVLDMPKAYRMAALGDSFDQRYEEIRKWTEAPYPRNTLPFPESENYAKDGTRLRSKGECIWYNLLQERGILFRLDCALELCDKQGNQKTLYPDFLIQCLDGSFIIVEHLGYMGDLSYAIGFGEKSYWYFQDGFVLGRNYFATSDEPGFGTDSQMIALLVDRIEEMFYTL